MGKPLPFHFDAVEVEEVADGNFKKAKIVIRNGKRISVSATRSALKIVLA